MRKHYLDNIRWLTVVLVVFYHVLYMYNAEGVAGGLGKITHLQIQYYDLYLNFVYPWLMPILFIVSGISSRLYLESHSNREFIRSRTTKLLVPSTIGLFVFQFIQGYINMSLSNALDQMAEASWFVKYLIMAISGQGVLWFAQMLWLFSVILVGVRKLEKDRGWQLGKKVNLPITRFNALLKLLKKAITAYGKTNKVKSVEFDERLRNVDQFMAGTLDKDVY